MVLPLVKDLQSLLWCRPPVPYIILASQYTGKRENQMWYAPEAELVDVEDIPEYHNTSVQNQVIQSIEQLST